MNHIAIRNEIRRRVVAAATIAAATELKLAGRDFDSSGKNFWAEEHLIGGAERAMTNRRCKISSYLVQYDLCSPVGTSMESSEQKAAAIESALIGATFVISGTDCTVKKIKTSRTEGKLCNTVSVLLTIDLNAAES